MTGLPEGFDVSGPVQAEVFVVWLAGDHLELTGPCGAAPWLIELGATEHPVEVVARIVRDAIGEPLLVHSTSWRRDREALILSFVAVIDEALVGSMESLPIGRSDLARGEATAAPRAIASAQVIEHGLRHMAWLANDDPVVAAELPAGMASGPGGLRAGAVPEPWMRSETMDEEPITIRCACGWETTGTEPDVVVATVEHGRRLHNMTPTRDEVLAMAVRPPEPVDVGGPSDG